METGCTISQCTPSPIPQLGQAYSTPRRYLYSASNFLDWFTYVGAILLVIPLDKCGVQLVGHGLTERMLLNVTGYK